MRAPPSTVQRVFSEQMKKGSISQDWIELSAAVHAITPNIPKTGIMNLHRSCIDLLKRPNNESSSYSTGLTRHVNYQFLEMPWSTQLSTRSAPFRYKSFGWSQSQSARLWGQIPYLQARSHICRSSCKALENGLCDERFSRIGTKFK